MSSVFLMFLCLYHRAWKVVVDLLHYRTVKGVWGIKNRKIKLYPFMETKDAAKITWSFLFCLLIWRRSIPLLFR